jgi:hypothetical protein
LKSIWSKSFSLRICGQDVFNIQPSKLVAWNVSNVFKSLQIWKTNGWQSTESRQ